MLTIFLETFWPLEGRIVCVHFWKAFRQDQAFTGVSDSWAFWMLCWKYVYYHWVVLHWKQLTAKKMWVPSTGIPNLKVKLAAGSYRAISITWPLFQPPSALAEVNLGLQRSLSWNTPHFQFPMLTSFTIIICQRNGPNQSYHNLHLKGNDIFWLA